VGNVRTRLYQIVVSGHLGRGGREAFRDFHIEPHGTDTALTGELDRSGLEDVITRIRDLGLDLAELNCLAPELLAQRSASVLYRVAYCQHGSDQIQQRAAKIVFGDQYLRAVIQADVVDGSAGSRAVLWRDRQGADGEILPLGASAAAGGVHHAALHGAVALDLGRHDPH